MAYSKRSTVISDITARAYGPTDHYRQVLNAKIVDRDTSVLGQNSYIMAGIYRLNFLNGSLISNINRINYATMTGGFSTVGYTPVLTCYPGYASNTTTVWVLSGTSTASLVYPGNTMVSNTQRVTLATESPTAMIRGNSIVPRASMDSLYDTTAVWTVGGTGATVNAIYSTIEKMTFSNDTGVGVQRGTSANAKAGKLTGVSINAVGYSFNGFAVSPPTNTSSTISNIQKFTFASDTSLANVTTDIYSVYCSSSGANDTHAWLIGGKLYQDSGTYVSTIRRYAFATDTTAATSNGFVINTNVNNVNFGASSSRDFILAYMALDVPLNGPNQAVQNAMKIEYATSTVSAIANVKPSEQKSSSVSTR